MTDTPAATETSAYRCDDCHSLFETPVGPAFECSRCGTRQIEENRCSDCHVFMSKVADEACPDCESGDSITPVDSVWVVPGHSELFSTQAEALQWIADAPKREAARAAHKAEMDAHLDEHTTAKAEESLAILPDLKALAAALDETIAPKMVSTLRSSIETIEADPTFGAYDIPVAFGELALIKGVATPAEVELCTDYRLDYEDREAITGPIRARMVDTVRTDALRDKIDDWFTGGATVYLTAPEALAEFLPETD